MEPRVLKGIAGEELDRRQFLRATGATVVLGAAAILGGGLLSGCAPTEAPPTGKAPAGYESIRMVGGSIGAKSSVIPMVWAAILTKYYPEIRWSSSSGNQATNPIYVTKGTVQLASANPANYVMAYGLDKIAESRLRSISQPAPPTEYIFLIPEDKPWTGIGQVPKRLTLSPVPPGTFTEEACEASLKLAGLSKKDFNWVPMTKVDAADAWRTGKVDLIYLGLSGVEPLLTDMWTTPRKFKPMGLSPEEAAKAKAAGTFAVLGAVNPPVTGILSKLAPEMFKNDVISVSMPIFYLVRDDFPAEIAYRMAKIMEERNAEIAQMYSMLTHATPQNHIKSAGPPFDIHPGVAKYYKEKGYLK